MKSVYNFVISPIGKRYNNEKTIGDFKLITNTDVYNHEFVNRIAKVISVPCSLKTSIKPGDEVVVHHNVFRRWHDVKGREKNSKAFFNEDTYIVSEDQIFLCKSKNEWKPIDGYCFVQPIKNKDTFETNVEKPLVGVIKYTDGSFKKGDLVGFTPNSEYEFIIDGKRLYRVYSKFITIKYEYQGNEEEYNPSWA